MKKWHLVWKLCKNVQLSQHSGFSLHKNCRRCRKDFGEFSKSICSRGKNQNPRGSYPIGRELACQLARTFPFCEPWTIVDRSASMGIQYRTFWKSSGMWIDPGQGFGTGNHLSTALTLEILEQYLLDTDTFSESMIDLEIG